MLKKTIVHKDADGNDVETDAYFNLTKAEALELNIRNDLEVIGRNRNQNETMDAFHRILQMSYGVKTGDGRFIKVNSNGAPLYYEFKSTEAYSELFMEIFTNAEYATEFVTAILPAEVVAASVPGAAAPSQANVPGHLANHPSMQGYKRPAEREEAPAASVETPAQMEARIRAEIEASISAQNHSGERLPVQVGVPDPTYVERVQAVAETLETLPAPVSTTPGEAQQPSPSRDELS